MLRHLKDCAAPMAKGMRDVTASDAALFGPEAVFILPDL